MPIVEAHMSGVGHLTLDLIKAFSQQAPYKNGDYELVLVVPIGKAKYLKKYQFPDYIQFKVIPLPARIFAQLNNRGMMLPLDLILGKGAYLFPNYRNWPLSSASKSLTYIHDVSFLKYPETVQPKNLRYLQKNVAKWIKRTDTVLTLTETSKGDIVDLLSVERSKVEVVPCGVDDSIFFKRSVEEVKAALKKYNLKTKHYMLFVGNLEPRKNLKNLLLAYKILCQKEKEPPALIVVGADGWLNEDAQSLIIELQDQGLSILRPSKFVADKDMPALYSGASLFVHPALYEGFGMPPVEAMACRVPVAASNIPVLKEVLANAAIMFDPADPADMSKALTTILESRAQQRQLVERGVKRSAIYSWSNATKIIQRLI